MNTIIIQKDPVFRGHLENFVRAHPHLHLIDTFDTVLEAYQILFSHSIDLILLDSSAPLMPNIDFSVGIQKKPIIIFFHPSEDYIIRTDNCTVMDLLPHKSDTNILNKTILKAYAHFERQNTEGVDILISVGNKLVSINETDIVYIKSMQNYVQIVTSSGIYTQLIPLKKFHSQLSPHKFVQIHRSTVANVIKIRQVNRDTIIVGNSELPIGEKYKANFKEILRGSATLIKK
jgi:two-component system, LytTR family, response regulator